MDVQRFLGFVRPQLIISNRPDHSRSRRYILLSMPYRRASQEAVPELAGRRFRIIVEDITLKIFLRSVVGAICAGAAMITMAAPAHAWNYTATGQWAQFNFGTWTVYQDEWGSSAPCTRGSLQAPTIRQRKIDSMQTPSGPCRSRRFRCSCMVT